MGEIYQLIPVKEVGTTWPEDFTPVKLEIKLNHLKTSGS